MHPVKTLRISTYCLWAALLCLPVVVYWATQAKFGTVFVQAWLPGDDAARASYRNFLTRFGQDQILFVSWPGCSLDDPRLPQLSNYLHHLQHRVPALGIEHVMDSGSLIARLSEADPEIPLQVARQRLEGIAIGADGSCFIALGITDSSHTQRARLIHAVQAAAISEIDVATTDLILAGEPYQVYVIDRASRETMQYFVAPSSLLALILAWLCLRRWRITCLVFLLAGMGQLIGLALIAVFLGEMSAVLVVLPTLLFMLTLSATIHLTNYYRDCGGEANRLAGGEALALGIRPCVLATLTTVFGFGSLVVSQLKPVWHFGALACVGLLLTTAFLLSVFPAAIGLGSGKVRGAPSWALPSPAASITQHLTNFTGKHANFISVLGLGLLLLSSIGVTRLKTSTEFTDMFSPNSSALRGLQWIQEHVGPIDALEFVITFDKPRGATAAAEFDGQLLERLRVVAGAHQALKSSPHTASILSAITFLPRIPSGAGTRSTIRRAVLRRTITARLPELESSHLLADNVDAQQWRLSARIHGLSAVNFHQIQHELRQRVERSLDPNTHQGKSPMSQLSLQQPAGPDTNRPSLAITGMRAVIEKAHRVLLADLGGSFATAFVLIAPVMMLIVRGVRGGLLLMIPNVLPVALVFGSMGWLQVKLDVASILTASVALGIAVDDTLHFVTWYIRQRRVGSPCGLAVQTAMDHCARPMLHTTLICTGSMLPFFFSDFLPTSKFAALMILILAGAIAGDLLLLPALLQSRFGGWIGLETGQVASRGTTG